MDVVFMRKELVAHWRRSTLILLGPVAVADDAAANNIDADAYSSRYICNKSSKYLDN